MKGLIAKTQLFFKRNASTILTCVGAAGVIGTAVMAVKETPKAIKLIEEKEKKKGDKLTKFEIVKTAGPVYISSVVICASTIACIFGANILNKHQQAALASAYALLNSSFTEYKNKTKEIFGDDANSKIMSKIVKDKYEEKDIPEEDGKQLFFDSFSLRFFRSTMEEVIDAEKFINKTLMTRGYVGYYEFYDFLGLPSLRSGDEVGWSSLAGNYFYGYSRIEFNHEMITVNNGEECCVITMPFEPTTDFLY